MDSLRRWETATGKPLASFDHRAPVRDVAFSPDGRLLAGAAGPTVSVWDVQSKRLVRALQHAAPVEGVAFDPSGRVLLTIANDARVFDVRGWRQRAVLDQPGAILVAAFAGTAPLVVTGGRDDLGAIWDWRAADFSPPARRTRLGRDERRFQPRRRSRRDGESDNSAVCGGSPTASSSRC